MRGIVYLISRTNGFNLRLAVSIASFRRFNPDTPICILTSENDVNHEEIEAIRDTFVASHKSIGEVSERRRKSLCLKTMVNLWSPFDTTIFVDADTHVETPIDELFDTVENKKFVITAMCNWKLGSRKIRRRVEPWLKLGVFKEPDWSYPSINSGVFGWSKNDWTKSIFDTWSFVTKLGVKSFGGGHFVDEYSLNLIAEERRVHCVDSSWNAYGKYHPEWQKVHIYHHAGSKHFRLNWWNKEKREAIYPSCNRWLAQLEAFRSAHPALMDKLNIDKHTRAYLELAHV
jgi:hypothetical protein